jgi:hypothetical protein
MKNRDFATSTVLGHINKLVEENLSLYLDTKLIFLILEILAIETFLHAFVLVTTSSILKRVDIPVQLLVL